MKKSIVLITAFYLIAFNVHARAQEDSDTTKQKDDAFVERFAQEEEKIEKRAALQGQEAINYFQSNKEKFKNYYEFSFGALGAVMTGELSEFVNAGGGIDLRMNFIILPRFLVGMNFFIAALHKQKDFPTLNNYTHYETPALWALGLHTGYQLNKSVTAPLFLNLDLNYGQLLYQRDIANNKTSGISGFIPTFEVAKSIPVGKIRFSSVEYVGNYYYSTYVRNPNLYLGDLTFFVNYTLLSLTDEKINGGGTLGFGIRYKFRVYSLKSNLLLSKPKKENI